MADSRRKSELITAGRSLISRPHLPICKPRNDLDLRVWIISEEITSKTNYNMPIPEPRHGGEGKDIVYTYSDIRLCDERTGMNEPLVYQLFCQKQRWVAMFGSDKR